MKSAPQKDASAARLELLESMFHNKGISRAAQASRIPKRPEGQAPPLSFAQQRMWFLEQLTPGTAAYNIPAAVHMKGQMDIEALEESLNDVVRRHEALRTTFQVLNEQPIQVISEAVPVQIEAIDLHGLDVADRESQIRYLSEEEAQLPFDLAQGLPFRVKLLCLGEQEHVFLLTLHHIVSDETSLSIFFQELARIYNARVTNTTSALPALEIQYADYAAWQRQWLQGDVLEKQLTYWRRELESAPAMLELPTDHLRSTIHTHRGEQHQFLVGNDLTGGLLGISRENRLHSLHDFAGCFPGVAGPVQRSGGCCGRDARRQPHTAGDRTSDRVVCKYACFAKPRFRNRIIYQLTPQCAPEILGSPRTS